MRPILLNSCARAATAAEARFRIDRPIRPARATRVVALDAAAAPVVRQVARESWADARFFTTTASNGHVGDLVLVDTDGVEQRLSDVLTGVDVTVMVATDSSGTAGATAASAIGDACTSRGIMTAGLVLAAGHGGADAAVSALRPHARVIMVTQDEHDVSEVLTALRA